ncbi:hypothetical protein [Kitasatospora kifunensis]|uniref:Thymidylate kinase n=1 Tax=Kitasatospora kifunensis TaxID=58351 RepID=A0A7W7R7R0_KITKI|nr:hypothetical protein [Kitasatospora kifunensis]MBB4926916.1 dTMP kinase [Kitasatospora kifunensis]
MSSLRNSFVAIEGINGAGKSSIRDRLEGFCESQGLDVFLLGQHGWLVPAATSTILAFRERWGGYTLEDLLTAHVADRRATYDQIIENHLMKWGPLIGDRSLISDAPYLEALEGIPAEQVLERYVEAGLVFPDATVLVDIDTSEALQRIDKRGGGRKVYETLDVLAQVNAAYQRLADNGVLCSLTDLIRTDGSASEDVLDALRSGHYLG